MKPPKPLFGLNDPLESEDLKFAFVIILLLPNLHYS